MKILLFIRGMDGCTYHRLILPHEELAKQTDWEIKVNFPNNITTKEEIIDYIGNFNLFIFSRIFPIDIIKKVKEKYNTLFLMDIDDYWQLDNNHILKANYSANNYVQITQNLLKVVDYVITTTELLANKIRMFNNNVVVIPNALNSEGQFKPNPTTSDRIRFGIIGGISHYTDINLLEGVVNQLPSEILDKSQFVLCGFDKSYTKDLQQREKIDWKNNKWNHLEQILTNNYKTISPQHLQKLKEYNYGVEFSFDEPYKRMWAKDVLNYAKFYDEIDVLLVPLYKTNFNECKSELKMIEASVKRKATIISDVFPYKYCGINAIEKGGSINYNGNCLMIPQNKGSKGWCKAIIRLVNDNNLRNLIQTNISKLTEVGGKYNLTEVTKTRKAFYTTILKKENETEK